MASLYGIESEDDCRVKIDELLQKVYVARRKLVKDTVADLKSDLERYYKQRDDVRMSQIERIWFWPAIQHAYVGAPHLGSPKTWREGLNEIELNLKYYRPALEEKKMTIVDTLMAGVPGSEYYGVDETGQVFVLDEKGKPLRKAPEPIGTKVREQIQRAKPKFGVGDTVEIVSDGRIGIIKEINGRNDAVNTRSPVMVVENCKIRFGNDITKDEVFKPEQLRLVKR
jgi:hypothetical protein